jgi:thioredoxin-like negative regulator of GroEL
MSIDRIQTFRTMLERQPEHAMARFGLATELAKTGEHAEAAEHFATYLAAHDDEGNGWLRYAECLVQLDRSDEAREAITRGIDAANRHRHASLVDDLESMLDSL